jgi:hypothetical protein
VAEDYRVDPQLYAKCKESVETICADVEPGSGNELACLVSGGGVDAIEGNVYRRRACRQQCMTVGTKEQQQ